MNDKGNKIKGTPLLVLAIPILIEMLMTYTVPLVDIYLLSMQSDISVAAVSSVMPILLIGMSLMGAFQVAGISVCSKLIGAKKRYSLLVMQTWLVVLIAGVGIALSFFYLVSGDLVLGVMSLESILFSEAIAYYQVWGGGILLLGIYICFCSLLIIRGEMKYIMLSGVVMNIVNVTLAYALIGGHWGMDAYQAKGAAIASVVAWIVADTIVIYGALKVVGVRFSFRAIKKRGRKQVAPLLKIALPGMVEPISYQLAQMVLVTIVLMLSELSLVARSYLLNFFYITNIWNLAFANAIQTKLANSLGANDEEQAKRDVYQAIVLGVGGALTISIIFLLLGESIIAIYTEDPAVVALVLSLLWLNVIIDFGRSLNIVMGGVLKASGDAILFSVLGVIGVWSLAVGLGYYFAFNAGFALLGIWVAGAIDENARGVLCLARWFSGAWKRELEGAKKATVVNAKDESESLNSHNKAYAS